MYEVLIKNANIVGMDKGLNFLAIKDGRIAKIAPEINENANKVLDAGSLYLSPAFIDIHFHGASGSDFCDANLEGLKNIARQKLSEGVSTIIPSTLSLPESDIASSLNIAKEYVESGIKLCKLLGVHVEGPFINPEMAGAQNKDFLRAPDIEMIKRLSKIFKILKLSYSPELDENFVSEILKLGIVPSCVHSSASFLQFKKAYDLGLKNISHFGNRLSPITSRDIGATGAGLIFDDVYIEIIADKLHLSEDMLKLICLKKNLSKIILITDSMMASGMPDGEYALGGLKVESKEGAARLENGALAGSVLKMNKAIKNIKEAGNLSLLDAVNMATINPAESLGLKHIGKIQEGYCADICLFTKDFEVAATIVDGEIRYKNSDLRILA